MVPCQQESEIQKFDIEHVGRVKLPLREGHKLKVAYYSFIRVQEVCVINGQFNFFLHQYSDNK